MTITRLGIYRDAVPLSVQESAKRGADEDGVGNYHYNETTGMECQIHDVPEGVFFEAWHEDVGLVTWYRADTVDEVWAEIQKEVVE